jgi:PKHD-type hydroxylase
VYRNTVYRAWPGALEDAVCDAIIAAGDRVTQVPAAVGYSAEGGGRVDPRTRRTTLGFLGAEHWVNGVVMHYARLANNSTWRLDLVDSYGAQYGTYRRGDFFDWHKDEFDMPHSDLSPPHLMGLNRKLSLVINLTDPRRYRGGDLLLKDVMGNVVVVEGLRARGSVIVFPSSVLHIASPVTRGVRQSLVAWVLGPSLR